VLVADAGWMFGTQTVQVDKVVISSTTHRFDAFTKDTVQEGRMAELHLLPTSSASAP
jgi:hypothetical protein